MSLKTDGGYWWSAIAGPNSVVTQVARALQEKSTVLLKVPADLPWRYAMRQQVEQTLRGPAGLDDMLIEMVDADELDGEDTDPGRFLLERFSTEDVQSGYRGQMGTVQDYILRHGLLRGTVVWLKGLDGAQAENWLRFCRGFMPKTPEEGRFILEAHGDVRADDGRRLRVIDFARCVNGYDLQLFDRVLADELDQYSGLWKNYVSTAAAKLCGTDAEVSAALLEECDFLTEEPLDGLRRVAGMPAFDRRGRGGETEHVLYFVRTGGVQELEERLWSAQVQELFPIIEREHIELIQQLEGELADVLVAERVEQYGEVLTDPMDLELGTLVYLMASRNEEGYYKLYIPDEAIRERIRLLRECRNQIAHRKCCSVEQVRQLLTLPAGG